MNIRLDHIPGPEFEWGGESYLYFGGTAYLGMQQLPEFKRWLAEATLQAGTHWGASRGGNVVVDVYEQAERRLAAWAGSEAALTLSSGFLAGRVLTDHYAGGAFHCFFSPSCHAALLPPGATRAADWDALRKDLRDFLGGHPNRQAVVFTDTLDFRHQPGPVYESLESLPVADCILVADDSHGLGILGPGGSGSFHALKGLGFRELLVCGSLGKALGVTAGLVLGSAEILRVLAKSPLFTGASPAPPAAVMALTHALETGLYARRRERLLANMAHFALRIGQVPGLKGVPGHPVWTFRDPALAEGLFRHRILITHFDYPAEGGSGSPSRIVLTASHTPAQLDLLASRIVELQGLT